MFQDAPTRVRVRASAIAATDELFKRASHLGDLGEIEAICIDFDRCVENQIIDRCYGWIDKGNQFKLQVFLIGSRELLGRYPALLKKNVTFLEKTGALANRSSEEQAHVVSDMLEGMFRPFRDQKNYGGEFARKIKKTIDPAYFQPVLTDDQDQALLAFLRTPAGE
ncbi:MAG TPA: hypothetical protein VGJ51_18910 [Candidatus Angelobacter sp.]|jgi:hypothetical protein